MDQLYTVDEMMVFLKVSRPTMYNYMTEGVIPYVQVGGTRRFIGSQVMKALKDLQTRQNVEKVRDFALVHKDTLSDVSRKLTKLSTNANKDLKKQQKASYKIRNSKINQSNPR